MIGLDTGFFFVLSEGNAQAAKIFAGDEDLAVSVITLYELQKKLMEGRFQEWETLVADLRQAVIVAPLTEEAALLAANIAFETKMPGLDALILASLLAAGCGEILTTDAHFERCQDKGARIVNLTRP